MYQILHKEIDEQGRIITPKEWRQQLKSRKVVVVMDETTLKIYPESKKLSSFFDKARPSSFKPDPFECYEESLAEASLR